MKEQTYLRGIETNFNIKTHEAVSLITETQYADTLYLLFVAMCSGEAEITNAMSNFK